MRNIKYIIIAAAITIVIVFAKNLFSCHLSTGSSGMPGAVKMGVVDNLFAGSSVFKQGLDIKELEAYSNDSYILAYNGNQPFAILQELKKIFEKGTVVKNLYMDMYPWTLCAEPWISDMRILWDSDFEFKIDLWRKIRPYATLADAFEFFVTANNDYLFTYPVSAPLIEARTYKGGVIAEKAGVDKETQLINAAAREIKAFSINEEQKKAIMDIASLCRQNGINLCFIEIPKYYLEEDIVDYKSVMSEYTAFLDEQGIEYHTADSFSFDNTDPSLFLDLMHLSSSGRRLFTRKMIEVIQ